MKTILAETNKQVERLNQAFELLEEKAKGKVCKGLLGLVEEGQETITDGKKQDDPIADLALIGAAQRVEHYEIAAYGTARRIAEQLGRVGVVQLLEETLEEAKGADDTLTKVAQPLYSHRAKVISIPTKIEEKGPPGAALYPSIRPHLGPRRAPPMSMIALADDRITGEDKTMVNRVELEGFVSLAIRDLRLAESNLARRYQSLDRSDIGNRLLFVCSLEEFNRRTTQLESLVNQLGTPYRERTAA